MKPENHERLIEIHDELISLLNEAKVLIRKAEDKRVYESMITTFRNIDSSLGGNVNAVNIPGVYTLAQAIDELAPCEDEDDTCEENEDV